MIDDIFNWKIRASIGVILTVMTTSVPAAWVKFGENDRTVAYYEPVPTNDRSTQTVWVMYDYKAVQMSPSSGRIYSSQKGQQEMDCPGARSRTLFFTWHAGQMGDGKVVYTGNNPMPWEPNSPGSFARSLSSTVCVKK